MCDAEYMCKQVMNTILLSFQDRIVCSVCSRFHFEHTVDFAYGLDCNIKSIAGQSQTDISMMTMKWKEYISTKAI